jgi:hypothetical protein
MSGGGGQFYGGQFYWVGDCPENLSKMGAGPACNGKACLNHEQYDEYPIDMPLFMAFELARPTSSYSYFRTVGMVTILKFGICWR